MMDRMPRRHFVSAVSVALPLIGCSLLPTPHQPRIYRLNPTLNPAGPAIRGKLTIASPTAPLSLDTSRIAVTRGPTRFDYFADSVWTDRLPALLQTLLLEAFESSGRVPDVEADTGGLTTQGTTLHTDIRQFEARYADLESHHAEVIVALDLRLGVAPEDKQIGRTLIGQRVAATQNGMDAIVTAFDGATAAVLRQTVEWTLSQMAR